MSTRDLVVGIVIGLVVGLVSGYVILPITQFEQRITELERQVTTFQGQIDQKDNQITSLQSQIDLSNTQVADLQNQISSLQIQITNLNYSLITVNSSLRNLTNNYFLLMEYINSITGKVGKAIQIQSVAKNGNDLLIYVQNVGQGSVSLTDVYVNGLLEWHDSAGRLMFENQTVTITLTGYCSGWQSGSSHDFTVRVVTADGTFMEASKTIDVP